MADDVSMTNSLGIRIAMGKLHEQGIEAQSLLIGAGLDPAVAYGPGIMAPFVAQASFFELAAEALNDDFLGLNIAKASDPMALGPITYVGLVSETFGDALSNFRRYLRLLANRDDLAFRFENGTMVVFGVPRPGAARTGRQMADCSAFYLVQFCRHITSGLVRPMEVGLPYAKPADPNRHNTMFGCPVSFGHDTGMVRFDEEDLALGLPTADSRLHRVIVAHCDTLLSEAGDDMPQFLKDVRSTITQLMPVQRATIAHVAKTLGISERTLQRRLMALESSFAKVRDDVKYEMAHRLLLESEETIAHIAYILNYSSQSSFNSAFRRLTGKTPGEVRKSRLMP